MKDNEEEDYGDVIIVFSGDVFSKFFPVSAFSVHQSPAEFHTKGKLHPFEELWYRLWNSKMLLILKRVSAVSIPLFETVFVESAKENI